MCAFARIVLHGEQTYTKWAVCPLIFCSPQEAGVAGLQSACGLIGQPYVLPELPASCCVGLCQPERPVQYEVFCVRCSRDLCVKRVPYLER